MDQKHRDYCIRLGNPFMKEQAEQEGKFAWNNYEQQDYNEEDNWFKNSRKFTN